MTPLTWKDRGRRCQGWPTQSSRCLRRHFAGWLFSRFDEQAILWGKMGEPASPGQRGQPRGSRRSGLSSVLVHSVRMLAGDGPTRTHLRPCLAHGVEVGRSPRGEHAERRDANAPCSSLRSMTSQGSVAMEIARNRMLRLDCSGVCMFARESQRRFPEHLRVISTVVRRGGWRSVLLDGGPHDLGTFPDDRQRRIKKAQTSTGHSSGVGVVRAAKCRALLRRAVRQRVHHAGNVMGTRLWCLVERGPHRPHECFPARTSPQARWDFQSADSRPRLHAHFQ